MFDFLYALAKERGFFWLARQSEVDELGEAVVALRAELDELKSRLAAAPAKPAEPKPPHVTSGNAHKILRRLEQRDAQQEAPQGAITNG